MNLQKINWKIFLKDSSVAKPDDFFRVFDTWIAALSHPGTSDIFIDVADYQHVHDGPLTLLIGHAADFALDDSGRRRGLLYSRKRGETGNNSQKLKYSLSALLKGAERLEKDSVFNGKLSFKTDELLLIINDRALAPNTQETYQALKPELDKLAATLFGNGAYTLEHLAPHPQQRFTVHIKSKKEVDISSLNEKLK